jgi:calpain-15
MSWWKDEDYEDEDEEEEEEPPKQVLFRDKDEISKKGHELYTEVMNKTSNKNQKDAIRQIHQNSGNLFTDPQFPPNSTSLAKDWQEMPYQQQKVWKSYVFKRIEEIFPQPIKVFDDISPNDILQGSLGDCYYLSTLSAIAEFPKRIMRLFDTQDYQPSGCYTANIYEMGVETDFVVDSYFPCTKDGKIAFSGPKIERGTTELWVLILEKAWAKRFGSYWDIDAGLTEDVLTDLTGAPCECIDISSENIWTKIYEANTKNYIMTSGSSGDDGCGDLVSEVGLITLHAYAIIDAQEIKTKRGVERLLNIRNPWGGTEWTGDWSDHSPLWTPEIKKKLNWQDIDDGSFWMSFEDFSHYFSGITICKVHDDYKKEALHKNQQPGENSVFKVTVAEGGDTYFMVIHADSRRFGGDENYEYSPVRLIISKQVGNKLERVAGIATAFQRDTWIQTQLTPGDYLVYVEILWTTDQTDQYGFSVYSASSIKLSDVTFKETNYFEKLIDIKLAKSIGEKRPIAPNIDFYEVQLDGENEETGKFFEGVYFDIIHNNTKDNLLEIEVLHKSFDNISLYGQFKGRDSYKLTLKPGEVKGCVKIKEDLTESVEAPISIRKTLKPFKG